jgi:hypothetical protein
LGIAAIAIGVAGISAATGLVINVNTETAALRQRPPTSGSIAAAVQNVNTRTTAVNVLFPAGGALAAAGLGLAVAF